MSSKGGNTVSLKIAGSHKYICYLTTHGVDGIHGIQPIIFIVEVSHDALNYRITNVKAPASYNELETSIQDKALNIKVKNGSDGYAAYIILFGFETTIVGT